MARFHYRAVASSGEIIEGEVEAASQAEVVRQVRGQGHMLLAADPVRAGASLTQLLNQPLFGAGKVKKKDVAILTRELSTLLGAGLTLDQALGLMIELAENASVRRLMGEMLDDVQGGKSLADALARHDRVFDRAYISMVRAGEAGGSLTEVLQRLAQHLDEAELLTEQVRSALIYPIILLIMAGLSIAILLTVVLPQFTQLFESADAELPLITQVIIGTGAFVQESWWIMLLVMVILVLYGRRLLHRPASRAVIDRWLLGIPLAGELATKLDTARFARTLATLIGNGVPLLQALAIVRDTLVNSALREAVAEAALGVKEGQGLAAPLERTGRFPKLALNLASVGERSGRLESMLIKIADIYDREVKSTIDRMMTLFVPVLTIGLGMIIATIIGGILSAILQAYQLPL